MFPTVLTFASFVTARIESTRFGKRGLTVGNRVVGRVTYTIYGFAYDSFLRVTWGAHCAAEQHIRK